MPVMCLASSEASQTTAAAMSSGSLTGSGRLAWNSGPSSGSPSSRSRRPGLRSVFTPWGWTEFTRMRYLASSLASVLARPVTPCLAAT
jgi:hypothetical protein